MAIKQEHLLSKLEMQAIYSIFHTENPSRSDVRRDIDASSSHINNLISSLIEASLLEQAPHPSDGRKKVLELTEEGVEVAKAVGEIGVHIREAKRS